MDRFTQLALASLVCACAAFSTLNARADIVISGTRIIYPQSSKDVTVKMENRGNNPLLVQSWLDDGRDTVNPQELKLPFVVTPPVSRIDPSKGKPYVLHGPSNLWPRIGNRCSGLTSLKCRRKRKMPIAKTHCSWRFVPALRCFSPGRFTERSGYCRRSSDMVSAGSRVNRQ